MVLKGYPRLSETFIAQEILGLEREGLDLVIVSMRKPTDSRRHAAHQEIRAPVLYLPEYLHEEPLRVLGAVARLLTQRGFWRAFLRFALDCTREPTVHRIRRFGQAAVLAAEWPEGAKWLHVHFIHTPASVALYAGLMAGVPWTCSAHAKDIWTTSPSELERKLHSARWVVTCTRSGFERLRQLGGERSRVVLSYHGIDLQRFGRWPNERSRRDGSRAEDPVVILSVGRAVEKKGHDVLLRALAELPRELAWRLIHIGGGDGLSSLQDLARALGISDRVLWDGARAQDHVLERYRQADLFALACRIGHDGDRDGLPNVLVEAGSQRLPCVSTDLPGIVELLRDGLNGLIVKAEDASAFAKALARLIADAPLRLRLGEAAEKIVRENFDHMKSVRQLVELFDCEWRQAR
ncbi:MAG TPA: glycosyltransferase family 4 protein [Aestuariivirgaceae bacterium]